MTYDEENECRALIGFVGCPHCSGPVDVRANVHSAVADFLDYLLVSLDHTKRGKTTPKETLETVWKDARERRWWYLEDTYPYCLLAPFWEDGLAPDPRPTAEAPLSEAPAPTAEGRGRVPPPGVAS